MLVLFDKLKMRLNRAPLLTFAATVPGDVSFFTDSRDLAVSEQAADERFREQAGLLDASAYCDHGVEIGALSECAQCAEFFKAEQYTQDMKL